MTSVFCCVADGFFHWRKQKQELKDSDSNIQDTGTHISHSELPKLKKERRKSSSMSHHGFQGPNLPRCEFGKCVLVSPNEN